MEKPASPNLRPTVAIFISALCVVVAARALRMGFKTWGELASFEPSSLVGFLGLYVVAFTFVVLALAGPPEGVLDRVVAIAAHVRDSVQKIPAPARRALTLLNTVGPLVAVVYVIGRRIYTRWGVDYFGTDGLLFAQYAVDTLVGLKNPYAVSMVEAFDTYAADMSFGTYRIDGNLVAELSYPAMSIWAFVPQKLMGIPCLDLTSLVVLMVVFVWLVWRAPLVVKWAAPGLLWAEWGLVSFTAGGVFDILWTLPVIASMVAFAHRRLLLAGVCFGIACSTKQTPWFIAPFVVIWLWHEAPSVRVWLRDALRFGGSATAAFLALNGPFIVADFGAWLRGVLVPVAGGAPLVELGAGPIMLDIAGITHAPKLFFSLLMAIAFVLTAIAYSVWFKRVKWLAFSAPMLVLWFNYRSLHNYYVYLLPVVLMGVLLKYERDPTPPAREAKRPGLVFGVSCAIAAVIVAFALVTLSPRTALNASAAITDMRDPDALGRISEMTVDVTNTGTSALTPTFGIVHTGHQTPVHWTIASGPAELEAGASATFELTAPMPSATVPYDAAMHLRVYDRGTERRTSVLMQRVRDEQAPAIANHTFQQWGINAENGLRQPLSWTARATSERTSLDQVIKRGFTGISIDASPGVVSSGIDAPVTGFELRGDGYCIEGVFAAQQTTTIADRKVTSRTCKVIGIPAVADRPLHVELDLRELVGAEYLGHFFKSKGDTRLILFGAATRFHDVHAL